MLGRIPNAIVKGIKVGFLGTLGALFTFILDFIPLLEKLVPKEISTIDGWDKVLMAGGIGFATAVLAAIKRYIQYKAELDK
jgi:hypothetical protein